MTNIAIGALLVAGLASLGVTTASAATPVITATPNTGLVNGSTVTVTGTGFMANEQLYALECAATATSAAGCDLSTVSAVVSSATGAFSTTVTVVTGTITASTTCGTSSSDLTACDISVGTNPASTDEASTAITFALPSPTTTTTTPPKTGPRRFHVSSVSGLTNHESVRVWGTGFKAKDQVYVVECLVTAKSQAGCDLRTLRPVKITAKGVLPTIKFKVVTGRIGTGTCGTMASNLKSCAISVANATRGDSGRVRITFKLP